VAPVIFSTLNTSLLDSPLSEVDALLGAATDLWPTIHRLSQMLSLKTLLETAIATGHTSKASILRTEIESTAHGIELALAKWQPQLTPPIKIESVAAESFAEATRIQSILNNAEAYRHSAFVYLYRIIRLRPRSHFSVQKHAHLSLLACSSVVQLAEQFHNVSMPALLWPLFVAACEATTEEDRALATDAFIGLERRQGMRNIMRAWEVVQEVWRRADLQHCGEVNWRDVCAERGLNIVFG
jgi:Fungal specific transcription factor domain